MKFSFRLKLNVVSAGLIIALFGPLAINASAEEREIPVNPYRQEVVSTDQLWGELPNDPGPISTGDGPFATSSDPQLELVAGSVVLPTKGRFVRQGDQWLFVADFPEFAEVVLPSKHVREPVNVFRMASEAIPRWPDKKNLDPSDALALINPLRTEDPMEIPLLKKDHYAFVLPDEIVVEGNLMLQRVIHLIQNGDHTGQWLVSGEVIKSNGQQRLLLHTAEPANE